MLTVVLLKLYLIAYAANAPADTRRLPRRCAQAIFQCLQGLPEGGMRRIILTASGGAFRDWPVERLQEVTAADAVKHPNWRCELKALAVQGAELPNHLAAASDIYC